MSFYVQREKLEIIPSPTVYLKLEIFQSPTAYIYKRRARNFQSALSSSIRFSLPRSLKTMPPWRKSCPSHQLVYDMEITER